MHFRYMAKIVTPRSHKACKFGWTMEYLVHHLLIDICPGVDFTVCTNFKVSGGLWSCILKLYRFYNRNLMDWLLVVQEGKLNLSVYSQRTTEGRRGSTGNDNNNINLVTQQVHILDYQLTSMRVRKWRQSDAIAGKQIWKRQRQPNLTQLSEAHIVLMREIHGYKAWIATNESRVYWCNLYWINHY